MGDLIYELYKQCKKLIEIGDIKSKEGLIDYRPILKDWRKAIKTFDKLGRGYAERYEKEKNNEPNV